MIDKIEKQIAYRLALQHNYPYAQEIYLNIFKKFSHFPLNLSDINIKDEGDTITFLALVVYKCFKLKHMPFLDLYKYI